MLQPSPSLLRSATQSFSNTCALRSENRTDHTDSRPRLTRLAFAVAAMLPFVPYAGGQASAQQRANANAVASAKDSRELSATLPPVTVTATRTENTTDEVPATVSIITSAEIEQRLQQDLRDLLRFEPNVSTGNNPSRFGLTNINIRGIEGNRILMQVDGVRLPDQFSIGSFAFATRDSIDPDLLKSAEILRGPGSSLYGSDALGGVVSFFTKDPSDFLKTTTGPFYGAVRATGTQVDTGRTLSATFAGGRDSPFQLLLHATRREGEESDNFGTNDSRGTARTKPNQQTARSTSALAKLVWEQSPTLPRFRLTVETRDTATKTDVATLNSLSPRTTLLLADDSGTRQRITGDLAWKKIAGFDLVTVAISSQDSKTRQRTNERRDATTATCSGVTAGTNTCLRAIEFSFDQDVKSGNFQATKTIDGKALVQRITAGVDYSRTRFGEMRDGQQTIVTAAGTSTSSSNVGSDVFPVRDFPTSLSTQTGAYIQNEMLMLDGNLVLTPSLRYDRFKLSPESDAIYAADNPGVPVSGQEDKSVSPRIGVLWKVLPTLALYGQYARGFRAPPYNDVNFGFTNFAGGYTAIPNATLKAETSRGVEYGVRGTAGTLTYAITGFDNRYTDFISSLTQLNCPGNPSCSAVVPITFQSVNFGKVRIKGWEVRARASLDALLRGTSVTASAGQSTGDNQTAGLPLDSVDPRKVVVGVRYDAPSRTFGGELLATSVAAKGRVSTPTQFLPQGYTLLDAFLYWNPVRALEINVGVYNLTDKKVWQWGDVRGLAAISTSLDRFTQPGRNISIAAKLVF